MTNTETLCHMSAPPLPDFFTAIGYTAPHDPVQLAEIRASLPQPGAHQVLIHVLSSSLNQLDEKLARLNFSGREGPVILGSDLAGIVVAVGADVRHFAIGDAVMAMADSLGDGGWATGGTGGYALAREYLTVAKPATLSFNEAAALPMCFLSAYCGLFPHLTLGDSVFIPGGAGGVGHLAVQLAARILGAAQVITNAGRPESMALAKASGADFCFDYRTENTAQRVMALTNGRGADLVFDATYSESSFVSSASSVRQGGKWVVLGVGPGKTSRGEDSVSPVAAILAERGAQALNVNLLGHFSKPVLQTAPSRVLLASGLAMAAQLAGQGRLKAHVGARVAATVEDMQSVLQAMRAGNGAVGKTVVELRPTEAI